MARGAGAGHLHAFADALGSYHFRAVNMYAAPAHESCITLTFVHPMPVLLKTLKLDVLFAYYSISKAKLERSLYLRIHI